MSILLQRVTLLRRRAQDNVPAASYWLCCVLDDGGRRRHRIDKYLDTLLANQTARKAMQPTIDHKVQRKMADCQSYY